MHSAIVVFVMPEMPYDATSNQRWQAFMASVDRLEQHKTDPLQAKKGVERLGENVWLVKFVENPEALARLVSCSERHKLPYKILQLDAAPQWLLGGSDPTSKEVRNAGSWQPPDDN